MPHHNLAGIGNVFAHALFGLVGLAALDRRDDVGMLLGRTAQTPAAHLRRAIAEESQQEVKDRGSDFRGSKLKQLIRGFRPQSWRDIIQSAKQALLRITTDALENAFHALRLRGPIKRKAALSRQNLC